MHSFSVIHRDIKPNHIFLNEHKAIKIIDLGLSIQGSESIRSCGTPGYLSPELFLHAPWSQKCDVFSLGVVFYKLLNKGVSCFEGQSGDQVLKRNK